MVANFRVNVVKNGFHVAVQTNTPEEPFDAMFEEYVYDSQRALFSALRKFLQTSQAETK